MPGLGGHGEAGYTTVGLGDSTSVLRVVDWFTIDCVLHFRLKSMRRE